MLLLLTFSDDKDRDAFAVLYEEYRDGMKRIALQILRSESDAEDVVHDTFVYAADHWEKIKDSPKKAAAAWLYIVTEHKALDLIRRRNKIVSLEETENLPGVPLETETDSTLASALARLPAHYREVILLHYAAGFSSGAIAEAFGTTRSAITALLHRAKKKLAELLREED